jgi:hypothetical protein
VYCERSCSEVKSGFEKLVSEADFPKQALGWQLVRNAIDQGLDVMQMLVFVAYFVDETEWSEDQRQRL